MQEEAVGGDLEDEEDLLRHLDEAVEGRIEYLLAVGGVRLDLALEVVPPAEDDLQVAVEVLLLEVYREEPSPQPLLEHAHAHRDRLSRGPLAALLVELCHLHRRLDSLAEVHAEVVLHRHLYDDALLFLVEDVADDLQEAFVRQELRAKGYLFEHERQQIAVIAFEVGIVGLYFHFMCEKLQLRLFDGFNLRVVVEGGGV